MLTYKLLVEVHTNQYHVLNLKYLLYLQAVKGPRYLELAEGYITEIGLDDNNEIIGYKFVNLGKMIAASAALIHPFFTAIAAPNVYAQHAFSKHIGCTPFTIS